MPTARLLTRTFGNIQLQDNTLYMKPVQVVSALCLALVSCGGPVSETADFIGNPYLPLWEHVPDGEPRVFEDPDTRVITASM